MLKYTLKRLVWAIITLWVIITITFIIMKIIPGNPFAKEGPMPPAIFNNLQKHYNLDKPEIVQYGLYLKSLLQFVKSMEELGFSKKEMISGLEAFLSEEDQNGDPV